MKVRITLKAKEQFGTTKAGELLTLYNDVFDAMNGIAFFCIDRSVWALESYDQWTGLTTKDKKEIYAEDTLKVQLPLGGFWGNVKKEEIGIVKYMADQGGYVVQFDIHKYGKNQSYVRLDCDIACTAEIIEVPKKPLVENLVKLFVYDTHFCAVNSFQLTKYQMEKYQWTQNQWNEYSQMYADYLINNRGLLA